ncbi:MAG TPA: tRNA (adenosine(37)-N6)-dimethylallyltransferase MiaA [Chroococcidiopsis sp.]
MSIDQTLDQTAGNTAVLDFPSSILIVIGGPTATGKSGLAIALAQRLQGAILSADSRQVYRQFDIGTAKPSAAERAIAPHYLIDICDPTETLTLADYQHQAQGLIAAIHQSAGSCTIPLLVGGTGLYIKAITRGMKIPRVAPQPALRSQLQRLGQAQCYAMLQQVDAIAAAKIHPNDPVRTLRALEVFYVTGQPISAQQGESPPHYPIIQIGLDCLDDAPAQPDRLTQRIARRTDQMIAQGFVTEVESLCRQYGDDLPLLNTLGYQEIRQYLNGSCSLEEAIALTVLHTRQFAKRQRTWFRADPTMLWFDSDRPDLVDAVWARLQQEQDWSRL